MESLFRFKRLKQGTRLNRLRQGSDGEPRNALTLCARMLHESPELLALLFTLAVFAGLIDTMAGGGGLLVVPGLMAVGLDPISAFATNKLQAIFGTASATVQFWRRGRVRLKDHLFPAGMAFFSSVCGAATLSYFDPKLLNAIVPFILISVASIFY